MLCVDDVDATFARIAAGATSGAVADQFYGDRVGTLVDRSAMCGRSPPADVSVDGAKRRMAELCNDVTLDRTGLLIHSARPDRDRPHVEAAMIATSRSTSSEQRRGRKRCGALAPIR
jgi:hypothetical protein